jgi:hypothetical protein
LGAGTGLSNSGFGSTAPLEKDIHSYSKTHMLLVKVKTTQNKETLDSRKPHYFGYSLLFNPKNGDRNFLRNKGKHPSDYKASQQSPP